MGLGERNGVSLAIHLRGKKYISVHTLVLARGKKIDVTQEAAKWPFEFLLQGAGFPALCVK